MLLIVSATHAGDKDKDKDAKRFSPGPASSYEGHQEFQKVRVAAIPIVSDDEARPIFGKVNPYKKGVLPILVVMDNNTGKALRLNLEVAYVTGDGQHVQNTPAVNVTYLEGPAPKKPSVIQAPIPVPIPRSQTKKGALNIPEIEGYAFNTKMIPPGETVHGFFYFQVEYQPAAQLYISGIREAATNKELFYFEVPLIKQPQK
jgi:hypothetical protein